MKKNLTNLAKNFRNQTLVGKATTVAALVVVVGGQLVAVLALVALVVRVVA